MTSVKRLIPVIALVLGLSAWAVGCKQQEGERCQTREDCQDDLECNLATQTCGRTGGGGIDAPVPPVDVILPDAAVDGMPDADVDAMIDAMIDAP